MKNKTKGRFLLIFSIVTRFCVLLLLCSLAMWTYYLNLKVGYGNARLVELSSGKAMRMFYEASDALFSTFGDPVAAMQSCGGMTWSIRILGVPFTDPIAFLSVIVKNQHLTWGFSLGLIIPCVLALLFGRVFCTYICPASLLFFAISRLRKMLNSFFYFPEFSLGKGFAWGILFGGLIWALVFGHGVWIFILPYFAMGQTIFHAIAFDTISVALFAAIAFALFDLFFGNNFTCRYLCPTGRLLGFIGSKSFFTIKRNSKECIKECTSCNVVCPLEVNPKYDETKDCSLCGECIVSCPTQCLSIGKGKAWKIE